MSNFGLSEAQVNKLLEESGIKAGEEMSSAKLRDAIATVIAKNNEILSTNIEDGIKRLFKEHDGVMHRR